MADEPYLINSISLSCSSSSFPVYESCLTNSISSPIPSNSNSTESETSPNFVTQYLIKSCGLSSEKAIRASISLSHLKSTTKLDSVLQFLKEMNLDLSNIKSIVSTDPKLLCANVNKTLRPNLVKLQKMGFSQTHLTQLVVFSPSSFRQVDLPDRVKALLSVFETVDQLLKAVKRNSYILKYSLERVICPNLCFLKNHCNLSDGRMVRLFTSCPRLITSEPDEVKCIAQRAKELGLSCQSGSFHHALIVTSCLNQAKIDVKLRFMEKLGFSKTEIACMVRKQPKILIQSEGKIEANLDFLLKEVECEISYVAQRPVLLMYSIEWRLKPRNFVRKMLKKREIPAGNNDFFSFTIPSEKVFVERFVAPYEDMFPQISEAYYAFVGKETREI